MSTATQPVPGRARLLDSLIPMWERRAEALAKLGKDSTGAARMARLLKQERARLPEPVCTCADAVACDEHATPCECLERGECLESCCCGGDGTRQPDTAQVTCWCREVAAELADEDALDEAEERRSA